ASVAPAPKPVAVSQPAPAPIRAVNAPKSKAAHGAASAQASDVVTVTGCLEQKNDEFRLKDTGGADAPKSRSWKTLGITKHASTLMVIDASNRLKLGSHVGERVSATGTLNDKELQLKSVKALSPSCE